VFVRSLSPARTKMQIAPAARAAATVRARRSTTSGTPTANGVLPGSSK